MSAGALHPPDATDDATRAVVEHALELLAPIGTRLTRPGGERAGSERSGDGRASGSGLFRAALARTQDAVHTVLAEARGVRANEVALDPDAARFRAALDSDDRIADLTTIDVRVLGAIHEAALGHELVFDEAIGAARLSRGAGGERRRAGVFFTPGPLIDHLIRTGLDPLIEERTRDRAPDHARQALLDLRICDPACGAGFVLLAAGRRLVAELHRLDHGDRSPSHAERRAAFRTVAERCLFGVDVDPLAVETCRRILRLEAAPSGDGRDDPTNIRCGDALLGAPASTSSRDAADTWRARFVDHADGPQPIDWHLEFPRVFARGGFHAILGNPPFLNQLETATAASEGLARLLRARFGGALRGYADLASAFLLLAGEITGPDGRIALVQPQSLLATRDVAKVRAKILERSSLDAIWVSNELVFEGANVFTCVPAFRVGGPRSGMLHRTHGRAFEPLPSIEVDLDDVANAPTWSPLVAAASGIPEFDVPSGPPLASIAEATADFRDQYYGLDGFIVEDDDVAARAPGTATEMDAAWPRLVTTGLIDPAVCRWGRIPTRVLKRRWHAPRIDRQRMDSEGSLGPWITARLVPKVLLATQTRVLEAWVDSAGRVLPSLPLITVTPHPHQRDPDVLWRIAAALASPVTTALAARLYAGAALNPDAIKLSAKQALQLPVPSDSEAWARGAVAYRDSQDTADDDERRRRIARFGAVMCDAHGLPIADRRRILKWWTARLTPRPRGRPADRGQPVVSRAGRSPSASSR